MGNLLVATHNYTGAVWHYEQAMQNPFGLKEAYNALRMIKCQQKFHQLDQSDAVQDLNSVDFMISGSSSNAPNCQQKIVYSSSNQHSKSRVLCQTVRNFLSWFILLFS